MEELSEAPDSETSGSVCGKTIRTRPSNQKYARNLSLQPSSAQSSEIFGAAAPIPLCQDPVITQSEQRRSDMDVMAESTADAMGKEEKKGGPQLDARIALPSYVSAASASIRSLRLMSGWGATSGYSSAHRYFSTT